MAYFIQGPCINCSRCKDVCPVGAPHSDGLQFQIDPEKCVSCGACEATCDAVFSVPEKMVVKEGVDFSAYESEVKDAADGCPAGVIKYE